MAGSRLSLQERAQIEVLFGQGLTFPAIGRAIGRDRSTVWREVTRNNSYRGMHLGGAGSRHPGGAHSGRAGRGGAYRWVYAHGNAHARAARRARRPRAGKLIGNANVKGRAPFPGRLWPVVAAKLAQRWSPRQIAHWLRQEFPDRPEQWVSHETIYQAIYYQARGGMRAELDRQVALRSGRAARRPQSRVASAGRGAKTWIGDLNISTRPAEAADRAVPGHWEGDLVIGARGSSAIITLVERSTRFVMLGALPNSRVSEEVTRVLIDLMGRVPGELAKTLTWDQGSEMAQHAAFTLATGCRVFFCDPHSPWQRGSNENTNGLLRQYFPRSSTDFRTYTQDDLDAVARELNRPGFSGGSVLWFPASWTP
ncbi:IS30 family transposase [Cellulomonas hominis]|uniref:IS30 family transposase n=1 Tax=Cellulomonas hominis TaxID=156981 RepID=A0A7W8SBQ7_9CELL|nr:IS30 family transposase [Cellulomonas hominis]MBB5472166.1 IS30 family transposase [Cellulomonas hominis]